MPSINSYNYQQIHDRKLSEAICVAAIVSVISFDASKMTVDVQPLSKSLQNGKYETQPPILNIPVACTRSGGFIFRPWIKPNDVGVVLYLDHDLDSTVTGGKEAKPLTERVHATTDAIFIGGIISGSYVANGIPNNSIALSAEDGSKYIAITEGNIRILGNVQITGNITVNGGIVASGDVISENNISGAHHTHPGDSGGVTGPPA